MWGAFTPLSLPYSWGYRDGRDAYTPELGCTKNGLGTNYSTDYCYLKFDGTNDSLVIQLAEAPTSLSYYIMRNGTYTGTFVVQESANGSSYSALASYTSLNTTATYQSHTLKSTTRYLKFKYVSKTQGNVGLGTITISAKCHTIDVTSGSAVILPAGSTTYSGGDWGDAGAPTTYPSSATAYTIGTGSYCVTLTKAADYSRNSNGLQFQASNGVLLIEDIASNYGVDVEILIGNGSGFSIALDGTTTLTGQDAGTRTISTTSTSADLTISKPTSGAGNVKYIKITPKSAPISCSDDPSIDDAQLNGSFNSGGVTSLTNTVSFSTTSCDPKTNCEWQDYGFVWGTSASPTVSNTKMQKGTSGTATSWDMTSPSTFTVDNTYKVRAYGKNGKTGAEFVYSASDLSFTPRSVAFNSNGGSAVATKYIKSGGTITSPGAPATPKTGYTFDSWRTDAGLGTEVNFSNAVNASTTYYAKWNAKQCTVTFDKGSGSGGDNSVTATYDAAMPTVAVPTKTDFIFGGYWDGEGGTGNQYYKADGTSNANWNKNTTSNTTLYANWTEHTYTNYRTLCSTPKRTIYLDATEFGDASGAQFGIYSWENADGTNNLLAEEFMELTEDCRGHIYVGEIPEDHDRLIFLRNSNTATQPVKDAGSYLWNKTVDITVPADDDFFIIASGGAGNTYTGTWDDYTANYTVTFSKNGISTTSVWTSDQCIVSGGKVTDPNITPLAMGKTFGGWYQEAGATNAWVFNMNTVSAATTIYAKWNNVATKTIYLNADATLSGDKKWDADNVTLFAHAYINGTSLYTDVKAGAAISTCQPHVYSFVIPGNATHVTFARCATGTEVGGIIWEGGSKNVYNQFTCAVEASKDEYRVTGWDAGSLQSSAFTPTTYTISYAAGTNGSGSKANESKSCDVAFTLPNTQVFTRDDYTMDGWATSDGGDKVYELGGSYTTNADQTFYPHWAACDLYTVTLNVNGSAWKTWTQGSCGASIDLSSYQDAPACGGGYTLVGWSTHLHILRKPIQPFTRYIVIRLLLVQE